MEVKIGLTHKCEILAEGLDDSVTLAKDVLSPCAYDYNGEVVFVEFITGKNLDSKKSLIITENEYNRYKYALSEDGLFVYYKVAIQKKEYMGQDYKKKIYYDNGKIMLKDKEINDPSELVNYLTSTGMGVLDFCEEPIYSLCKLEHCVFNLQKEILNKQVSNCGLDCNKNINLKNQRNFLFISLYVLQHLVSEEKYDEADEILEKLSSCGSLCKNIKNATNDCGCN